MNMEFTQRRAVLEGAKKGQLAQILNVARRGDEANGQLNEVLRLQPENEAALKTLAAFTCNSPNTEALPVLGRQAGGSTRAMINVTVYNFCFLRMRAV
jgi:hypothetical protein